MATVAFLSDSHLAATPDQRRDGPDRMLAAAVAAVRPFAPDLVVLPGDIADDGSVTAYERVLETVAQLGAPILATPGNHDLPGPLAEVLGHLQGCDVDGWRIVTVDSHLPETVHGRVDLDVVAAVLGDDDGTPTVLVIHHPPITLSSHRWFQLDGAAGLVSLLSSRNDVRIVVSGHLHAAFCVQLAHVTYLGCPSTLYAIDHHGDQYRKGNGHVGAVVLTLQPDATYDWRLVPGTVPVVSDTA
jgi:Icc protein